MLPLYSLKAAAGCFGRAEAVEAEGWLEADGLGKLADDMFICRAVGHSMEPSIRDGDYLAEYQPLVIAADEAKHVEVIAEMVTVLRGAE